MNIGPFGDTPSLQDWLLIGQLSAPGANLSRATLTKYLSAIGPVPELTLIPTDGLFPGMMVAQYPTWNLAGFLGTQTWQQWLAHLLGAKPVGTPFLPGKLSAYMGAVAIKAANALQQALGPYNRNPTVFAGHSLGAATALLASIMLLLRFYPVRGVWGLAMPQCIGANPPFTLDYPIWKLSGTGDPIPLLPPEEEITVLIPSGLLGLLRLPKVGLLKIGGYAVIGDETCLTQGNPLPQNRFRCAFVQGTHAALVWLARTLGKYHYAASYVQYLKPLGQCADKQPGAAGYAAPWILWDLDAPPVCGTPSFLQPQPSPVDPQLWGPLNYLKCVYGC